MKTNVCISFSMSSLHPKENVILKKNKRQILYLISAKSFFAGGTSIKQTSPSSGHFFYAPKQGRHHWGAPDPQ